MKKQNALFPFLWITGESAENVVQEIAAIQQSGAQGFCVESRTCQDFCGEKWWAIMDAVLAEAKARGMQVWLLDDKHYPTGYANGAIRNKYAALRPWRVKCEFLDMEGAAGEIRLLLNSESDKQMQDEILGVFAVKMHGNHAEITADITDCVEGDFLRFAYNGKAVRICTIKKTRGGAESANDPYYLDMLNPDSVDVLIREVYEPHYERYVKSGKYADTFVGFFSDEPRFANGYTCGELCNRNAYQSTLGVEGMAYPWNDRLLCKVPSAISSEHAPSVIPNKHTATVIPNKHTATVISNEHTLSVISSEVEKSFFTPRELLSLWFVTGENTPAIRIAYMNAITRGYGENFSGRLSAWCHARNLTYCGHIIEDMGAHARLGCSAGHYFRSQQSADYAAIDVVLHQIKPYYTKPHFAPIAGGYADPLFFDNTLAKLASSCARLYPEKEGRALCEIFGAYGWGESIKEMLYLVDHMLVRGINAFIPHAYSQVFPNADCPPHLGQKTPLFCGYKRVMQYMQKMCELFANERADIEVGILYHAEAEWSGKKYMPVDTVAAALAERQIDYDVIPSDKLDQADKYQYIIVPYAEYLSEETERKLQAVSKAKIERLTQNSKKELAALVDALPRTIDLCGAGANRVRAMKLQGKESYFLHNEGNKAANLAVAFAGQACKVTDPLCDTEEILPVVKGNVQLRLRAGQAVLLESLPTYAPKKRNAKTQNIPFEKISEDDTSVTYAATAPITAADELRIEYEGEWARIIVGDREYDFIGGVCVVCLCEGAAERPLDCARGDNGESVAAPVISSERQRVEKSYIKITVYKNLAFAMRDDLSKFDILRPTELKCVCIIGR